MVQAAQRIQKELIEISQNPPKNCTAGPKGDNLYEWMSTIRGPENSPYSNGIFFVNITFPESYPFKPPELLFKTRIYHCNINNGRIKLDIKDKWFLLLIRSPTMTISTVLEKIYELFNQPNTADPLVASIAQLYLTNREEHDRIAKDWTERYGT